jgi:hypothetical protein
MYPVYTINDRLVLIVSWIDENLIIGSKKAVEKAKKKLMERFNCQYCGVLEKYMGCKIERTENSLKFIQPVLIQRYSDEFELPSRIYKTPAQVGSVLVAGKKVEALSPAMQEKYCSGTGKAICEMQYLKPEMYNAVQDLSQYMHEATKDHYKAMLHVLKYSVNTVNQGPVLKPNKEWYCSQNHECHEWLLRLGLCQGA